MQRTPGDRGHASVGITQDLTDPLGLAGIVSYLTSKVPGLRREDVAQLAGVSADLDEIGRTRYS